MLHLPTQRVIGNVLGAIDDLIANNRRRMEVLEEMARAVYREWFVNFRYPGHQDCPLVGSDLGLIPDGWGVARCGPSIECDHNQPSHQAGQVGRSSIFDNGGP